MNDPKRHPYYRVPGERFCEARWIWARNDRRTNGHVLFRTAFEAGGDASRAWMFIAVESCARVFLNGQEVVRTSSLSYPGQHYCEAVELTQALRPGRNELAILAWYIGVPSGASCPKDPGLLAEIVDENGTLWASSGPEWKVCPLDAWQGQFRRSHWLNLDLIEMLDFRKLPPDFPMVAATGAFKEPEATHYPGARFITVEPRLFAKPCGDRLTGFRIVRQGVVLDHGSEHAIPSLAVLSEALEPGDAGIEDPARFTLEAAPAGRAWSMIVDLGSYEKGLPRITVSGDPGAEIDISWYEHIDTPAARAKLSDVHATDRYILSGGTDTIVPEEWKCGRYLQLTFRKIRTRLTVRDFHWVPLHYPLRSTVKIESSSKKLERIMEISLRTAALCMHDNIMDCPWRERRQWVGDVQRIALIGYYGFGEYDLPRAVLKQHVRLQDITGRMWVCLPVLEEFPTQSMEWLRAVLEYQEYGGDPSLLDDVADNIEFLHRWFMKCRNREGLFFVDTPPAMNWMDNSYGSVLSNDTSVRQFQFKTPFLAQNLRYLLFLDDVAECMSQVYRHELAEEAAAERRRLASILHPLFREADTGLLRDCAAPEVPITYSEMAHALAVRCDLPGIDPAALWNHFQAFMSSRPDNLIKATPFGKYHTHEALGKLGQPDAIVADILEHWGPMVEAGSDTTWEWFHGDNSRCHGWAGIPLVSMMRHVLRLTPGKVDRIRIDHIGGIEWIHGESES